ncbi:MAG TPA: DinB family protein [Ilumatobacteraceae bacterium]|nr:DinB family protein [Ilumatobacteraceae bacterium]
MIAPAAAGEREALSFFLAAQRASVLAIVDGLSDGQLRRAVVPSGWTPVGMIEHLGDAERVWFQYVVAGEPTDDTDHEPADVAEVVSYYRAQTVRSDEILAATPLDAQPAARPVVDIGIADDVITVRDVVLHMIEETARHAGHLDVARELIDGRTGLGPR